MTVIFGSDALKGLHILLYHTYASSLWLDVLKIILHHPEFRQNNIVEILGDIRDLKIRKKWSIGLQDCKNTRRPNITCRYHEWFITTNLKYDRTAASKIEKVPRGIRGEKSSKDMASSSN